MGDDGDKYTVSGQSGKIYNILSDKNLQYNARFSDTWGTGGNVMSEAGIKVGKDQLDLKTGQKPGTSPLLNGKPMKTGQTYNLDGGHAVWDGDNLVINTPDYQLSLRPFVSGYSKNGNTDFINGEYTLKGNPMADGVDPSGLWGGTIDGDTNARGQNNALEFKNKNGKVTLGSASNMNVVNQYKVSSLFANDFVFNRFGTDGKPKKK